MKKKRRTKRATYWGMGATTTSRDWGFGPVAGKGGNCLNYDAQPERKKVEYADKKVEGEHEDT